MASQSALISIDGSHGEGGGALVRTALVMSALTQQPFRLDNIRAGTRFPGLDGEDLTLSRALAKACKADVVGGEMGSQSLTFIPTVKATGLNGALETVRSDAGRGPNSLIVLSALLPVLARAGVYSSVLLEGETYGHNSLSFDYFSNVTLVALKKVGLYANPEILRPGFGRESEGEVTLDIEPSALSGIEWQDRGPLRRLGATVATSALPRAVADRSLSHLKNMASNSGLQIDAEHIEFDSRQPGFYITVWARYDRGMGGGVAMGAKGMRAETVAQTAFEQAFRWMSSNATVDEYLADQLLLPLILAESNSVFTVPKLTQRLLTSIWVVKQFTPIHLTVKGVEGSPGTITIQKA